MLQLKTGQDVLPLEFMHIALHQNQSSAQDLDEELPDRGRLLEIVGVIGEHGFQGFGRSGNETVFVEESSEAEEAVIRNILDPVQHFLARWLGKLRCTIAVENIVALYGFSTGFGGPGMESDLQWGQGCDAEG